MWILLHRGLPPDAVFEPGKVVYANDRYQAAKSYGFKIPLMSSLTEVNQLYIPLKNESARRPAGQITPLQTYSASDVLNFFREGVAFPASAEVIHDPKLRVALELYGAYFTELSANAKFLTLVMALETLATGIPRTQLVLSLLDKWKQEVQELQEPLAPDSEDAASLEALSRELLFRKEDSIRRQIRSLVFITLQANGDEDAQAMATKAVQVYDHRSTLVHEGRLDPPVLGKANSDAKNIVERVLRARFVQRANRNGKSMV